MLCAIPSLSCSESRWNKRGENPRFWSVFHSETSAVDLYSSKSFVALSVVVV